MKTIGRKVAVNGMTKEERTRTEILDAALKLYQRIGIRKTTLEDIAAALGKKKSFLYYYYAGKDEILTSCLQREMDQILMHTRLQIEAQPTPQAKVHAFFAAPLQLMFDRLRSFSLVTEELRTEGQQMHLVTSLRIAFYERESVLLQRILKEGITAKVFRPMKPAAMESFCAFAISAMRGIELGVVWDTVTEASLKHVEEVTGIIVRGLEA